MNAFKFTHLLLACTLALTLPAAAQIQGTQSLVRLPGSFDKASRISAFAYANNYCLFYQNNENGINGARPALYYGTSTASSATPPTLTFSNGTQMNVPGFSANPDLSHTATAILNNTPYVFHFDCARNSSKLIGISYHRLNPPLTNNSQPTFSTLTQVPNSVFAGIGNIFDVSCATLSGHLYFFLLHSQNSTPSGIVVYRYDGTGTGGLVQEVLNYGFASNYFNKNTKGVDATTVTLSSGEQAIVVVAAGKSQATAFLFSAGNDDLHTIFQNVPAFPLSTPPGSFGNGSARIAYGAALGTSMNSTTANSCTLYYGGEDNGFLSSSVGMYTTQLVLPPSLKSGSLTQINGWAKQASIWYNNVGNSAATQFPFCWTAFTVPKTGKTVATVNNEVFSDINQFITLMECGSATSLLQNRNSFIASLGIRLHPDPTTAGDVWFSSDIQKYTDPADIQAIVQSWTLLGVVTGIPPLPAGTGGVSSTAPILTLSYGTTTSQSSQTANTTVVATGISGNANNEGASLNASTGYTQSSTQGRASSSTIQIGLKVPFPPDKDGTYTLQNELGYLIVSEPAYETAHYDAFGYDGTTSLGIGTETISLPNTDPIVTTVPFYLDKPSTPYPGQPACIYQSFPVNTSTGKTLVTYPVVSDILHWQDAPNLSNSTNLFGAGGGAGSLGPTDNTGADLDLSSAAVNSYTSATSNKISVSSGVSFLGIGVNYATSFTVSATQSITFGQKSSSNITYPVLSKTNGYSAIDIDVFLQRLNDGATGADWMPTIFQGSKPWLLTYQVVGYTPYPPSSTGGGGTTPPKNPPCPTKPTPPKLPAPLKGFLGWLFSLLGW